MAQEKSSGISIQTLAVSAAAAVAAAVIVPMVWERGTLVATAMTPVIVALVSEALRHPAEKITSATSSVVRRPGSPSGPESFDPLAGGERGSLPDPEPGGDDPFGLRERQPIHRHWRLAVITGLVAFVVAVAALTLSELVFGGPATSDSGRTTFFGGRDRAKDEATPTPTPGESPTASPEEATPTPEATETPTETPPPTPTPGAPEATPAPTVTP
jgi:hypothetical protein